MPHLKLHSDMVAELAARLDLREPNRLAVETVDAEVSQHFDVEEREAPFEAVLDVATGVGKTYVMAGAMELLAHAYEVSDFVVIAPGSAILTKTINNFTPGHAKSLLDAMSSRPVVITADNFNTPAMRTAMDDPLQVKVYLFTVQSLLRPTSKQGRRVHKFQEGLGTEFYAHLQSVDNLVVFSDEHHTYYGKAFSEAVRGLNPWVHLGLTATPHRLTPKDQVIYRYPLAAAIADKLVKTPVIVGRKDDRTDALTKLADGVTLLRAKEEAIKAHAQQRGLSPINPVMLVVAKTIEDANEYGELLRSTEFFAGAYADAVLVVHSDSPDEALTDLDAVEDPASPVRIIISVGMLKEGWDVRNVYVIASMRASVSEILTEQTLGRGMRLPFGQYTEIQILDTLEVVAHERYADLLKKADVLNEAFVDHRTRAVIRLNAQGEQVVTTETVRSSAPVAIPDSEDQAAVDVEDDDPTPVVTTVRERTTQAEQSVAKLKQEIVRHPDAPKVEIPVLKMTTVESKFSLADITDYDAFNKLAKALASDPNGELSRTVLSARVVTGRDGVRRTELVTSDAVDKLRSAPTLFAEEQLRRQLTDIVLASPSVPARKDQRAALQPIIDAFFEGLGSAAESILSANLERAGARLVTLVASEQRKFMAKPSFGEVVELKDFTPMRATDKEISRDRHGKFVRAHAYEGWQRSMFSVVWFDSGTERDLANIVDSDSTVAWWVRLQVGDLPILWHSGGRNYNPDFLVIDEDGTYWIVEVKMDKDVATEDVQGKREAARRWANYVNANEHVKVTWRYLLVSETDVATSKGAWSALKGLGT